MDIMKVKMVDGCKFHSCISRLNIAYLVVEYNEQIEVVCQLVAKKLEQYLSLVKIIVYSSSINTIKELSSTLDCYMYYVDIGSNKEKDKIQWRQGHIDRLVIVASNAFRLGINKLNI